MTNASIYLSVLFCFLTSFDLFSQSESNKSVRIHDVQLSGNKRTKEYVILREIEFKKGDTLKCDEFNYKLGKSIQNIQNTSLFNFVEINVDTLQENVFDIKVFLVERWYIWPFAMIKSAENNFNYWWIDKNLNHLTLSMFIVDLNFRGAREQLLLKSNVGFDNGIGFTYSIPYINKKKTIGLMFDNYWSKNHEVIIGINDYKNSFYRINNTPLIENFSSSISFIYRPAFRLSEQFSITYNYFSFNDTIFTQNPFYAPNNKLQYLSFFSKFKIDYRDNKAYPLKGFYADLILLQSGINILSKENIYKSSLQTNFRFYHSFNNRFHSAHGINAYVSSTDTRSEFLGTCIGNNNHEIRGYENYRIPIKNYIILKNNIGFTLIKKTKKQLPFIKSENIGLIHYALYVNAFIDAALISEDEKRSSFLFLTKPSQNLFYSSGVGFDFVTYYDMVFRFEMSRNFLFNKWGFFVNLKASI